MTSSLSTSNAINDVRFSSIWLWLELYLLAIAIILGAISHYFKKMSNQQILHKRTVLITNGASSLSQALCEQLIETHKCRVALIAAFDGRPETIRQHESVQLFNCNLSDRQQVTQLAANLEKQFGSIELVIHQDCSTEAGNTTEQVEHFVSQSSNDILALVNLLTSFVPSMLQQGEGRIVSIKNASSSTKAFVESQSEYHDLVQSISLSQTALSSGYGPESVHFATIFCDRVHHQAASTKLTPNLNLTEHEIAQRILAGIESEQPVVRVNVRRNLLEFCSTNIAQLAAIGLDKLQLRKAQKIPIKVQ